MGAGGGGLSSGGEIRGHTAQQPLIEIVNSPHSCDKEYPIFILYMYNIYYPGFFPYMLTVITLRLAALALYRKPSTEVNAPPPRPCDVHSHPIVTTHYMPVYVGTFGGRAR